MYYLDTNTCIYYLNGVYENIKKRILSTAPSEIMIPSIVKAELLLGAYKSKSRTTTMEKLERFLQPFEIVAFEDQMTYHYADIRSEIETRGKTIGPNDILIAAIVRFHDGILVTNNVEEFNRIAGLKIENWV